MKKITNLLVCLVLAVLASTNSAWGTILYAVDGNGNTVPGLVVIDSPSKFTEGSYDDESDFSFDPITLYAQNNGNYTFGGFYTDATCTNSAGVASEDIDEGYYSLEIVEPDGHYYAKFTCSGDCGGGSSFTPQYYKVNIVPRKHTPGSSTMSNGGGRYYVSKTSSSSTWKTTQSGSDFGAFETGETNIVDFYLKAQTFNNNIFEGWYTDASCTNLISTSASYHYTYTQADIEACGSGDDFDFDDELAPRRRNANAESGICPPMQFTTKPTSDVAVATTIYAKFRVFEPDYYNVRAQVVSPDGNTGGQVFLCDGDLWGEGPDYTNDHYDSEYAYSSSLNGTKVYVDLYAKAKDGYEFVGWFADAGCTIPLSWNGNDYTQSEECTYSYDESDEEDVDLPLRFSTSKSEDSAPLNTVYAKFRSNAPQTYYAEVRYLADDNTPKHGAYFVTDKTVSSNVPITATPLYSQTISFDSTTTAASVEYGKYPNTLPTYYIVPARGYIKNSWVLTNVDSHDGSLSNSQFNYRFNATSTDAENPTVVTLKHTYKDATLKTMNIVSPEGHGSIRFIARNWVENEAHTGLEWKTIDLGTAVGETAENIDFYNTDSIFITAIPDEGYQFREWVAWRINKDEEYEELTFSNNTAATNPTYKSKGGGMIGGMKAYFDKQHHHYYAAEAEASKGGTVQVSFTNPVPVEAGTYISGGTDWTLDESTEITVYAQATPKEGYEFVGWKTSPSGAMVSFDANFSTTFNATSQTETSPTTLTLYAYFAEKSDYEAELIDQLGNSTTGTFAALYAQAGAGYTLVLHKNVNRGTTPLNINKDITIDFNNRYISGTVSDLITIAAGKTVTFLDNSDAAAGGISVLTNETAASKAVTVNGTLNLYQGTITCQNTSTDANAQATGIAVANGATLNLQGGSTYAIAQQYAYGVRVPNGATAILETGSVNATADNDAYAVDAQGNVNVTWSVAILATTTGGNNAVGMLIDHASAEVSIDGGTISATSAADHAYAIWAKQSTVEIGGNAVATAQAETASTAYAVKQDGAQVNVRTGRFASNNTQDIIAATTSQLALYGGYYVHSEALNTYKASSDVILSSDIPQNSKFYTEGYRYMLSDGDNPNYVVATANGKSFGSLEDAISYANNNPDTEMTILLKVPDVTLSAGNYTLPAKTTLLVPYMANQTPHAIVERVYMKAYVTPTPFCKLTLESGAHIDVYGTIETGGRQNAYQQSNYPNGAPTETFGWLYLSNDSRIVVASGGVIRAWGYISGAGTMDIRRGAVVNELFQILDWKGGTHTRDMCNGGYMYNEGDVFPVNQYFIQSVESRTTYHPGSVLNTMAAICIPTLGYGLNADKVQIIGVRNHLDGSRDDLAMFLMDDEDDSENTWVCKYYDVAADRQVYEVNNSAALGSLDINFMGEYTFTSTRFTLPFTNNMTVRLLSGEMFLTQNSVMLAGMQIEVNKLSTFTIPAGDTLFVYDADQWDKFVFDGYYAQRVKYSPSVGGVPTARPEGGSKTVKPGDASINLKGTMEIRGAVYTTEGGANIYSTNEDAGTILIANHDAPASTAKVCQWNKGTYVYSDCPSVLLKNADQSFTATAGAAENTSFVYTDGVWRSMETDDCFAVDKTDPANPILYAKPQEYVRLVISEKKVYNEGMEDEWYEYIGVKDTEGNNTHTYDYVASWDKRDTLLILTADCQWWKVVPVEESDTIFHCTHPDNDKYYYWESYIDEDTGADLGEWVEKRFTITWNNYDGTPIGTPYNVVYNSTPTYLGTNPVREMNDYYTYDFIGWLPEPEPVTHDVTYTAQFEPQDRRYLVTFLDADGTELETSLWKMGDVPSCVNQPTPQGKILAWEPTIRAVTGDATYRATYTDQLKSTYTITFVNWNGEELQTGSVATGTIPTYSGATPAKSSILDEAFVFAGWTPDLTTVSEDAVYTATFTSAPAQYTVTFLRAIDNTGEAVSSAVEIETQTLGYGETPVCSNPPVKTPTEAEYYTVIWSPQIAAVTGNTTYTATGFEAHKNTCRLTVSAGANGQVKAADGEWTDAVSDIYEFGTTVTIRANATTGYRFVRWSDGNTDNPRDITVNAIITLKAEFAPNQYAITWKDYDNSTLGTTIVNHGEMPSHAAPARADAAGKRYTFSGWTPAVTAATANATYTATYTEETLTYTIRFVLNNGLADVIMTKAYGDNVTIANPVPASIEGVQGVFAGWMNSMGTVYAAETTLPVVTSNEVYSAQYELTAPEVILTAGTSDDADAKDINISNYGTNVEASKLIIEQNGSATIPVGTALTVEDFILESNTNKSGQLIGSSRINVTGNAYFDVQFNGEEGTALRTWYAIAVPWEVDAENGILFKEGNRKLVLGRDFDLVWYDGSERAANGDGYACWRYLENETDKMMHPGKMYMMYFVSRFPTIRFEKTADAPIMYTADDEAVTTVETYALGTDNAADANWNGIANPSVCHAYLNAGTSYGQVLGNGNLDDYFANPQNPVYTTINLSSYKFVVGKPVFVQAADNRSFVVNPSISGALSAPRRAETANDVEAVWQVTIGRENRPATDNLFVQIAAEKDNRYVLGQDVAKGGVATTCPQLWVNRYDTKLSVNTQTLDNNISEFPLNIFVPQAGEYVLCAQSLRLGSDDYQVYLTLNGNVECNLTNNDYRLSLPRGTTTAYGLRVIARGAQLPTGMNQNTTDTNKTVHKVLINGQVYIIRNGETYSITGNKINR